ncbi:hypothetical protein K1719_031292 [Acacia pycnantha]|nr:hypothetical protein K1719_031292 [Acacia pycnantha]
MKEWLCEEKEISTPLTEEQKILLDSLPKLSMSDERLMSLCRPWKDALILTLLGKSANLEMMKDRIAWILRSKSFELIDLPNNYFLFKTGNRDLRLRLLFDGPWDVEDRIHSKGVDRPRKTEVATTTWRRKEGEALSSIKEGVAVSSEREKSVIGTLKLGKSLIESSESRTKEDVVGHIEKEKLNLDTDGKCSLVIGEPHLESSLVREKKEKVMKEKEKEGKASNALVGQPQGPTMLFLDPPSQLRFQKSAKRKSRPGEKNYEEKDIVDIVPCILDIENSSTITIKNGKNDDVDRGAEVSEVVPPSLPPDELIEHIADDADFMEGQESLVAETQVELGQDLDSGHARVEFFPLLLKLVAWHGERLGKLFRKVLPRLISSGSFLPLFISLVDLPILVVALEKVEKVLDHYLEMKMVREIRIEDISAIDVDNPLFLELLKDENDGLVVTTCSQKNSSSNVSNHLRQRRITMQIRLHK